MDPYIQFYSHFLTHSLDPKCLLWIQVVKIYSLGGVGSPGEYIELFGGGTSWEVVGCWLHVLEENCSMLLSSYSFASDHKVNGWLCATTASAVIFHRIPKARRLSAQALKLLNL